MSLSLYIHPVALLNICDYCTRTDSKQPQFVGALFGSVREREITVNQTFEVTLEDGNINVDLLTRRGELFQTVSPRQRLIGWFAVGARAIEPWMYQVHAQVQQVVESPVLGLFQVPFQAEMNVLPFEFFDTALNQISVSLRVDETEQIALQDVLSSAKDRNTIQAQIIKETRAMIILHQHLTQLRGMLESDIDDRKRAEIVSTVQQLCRHHDFDDAPQIKQVEQETLSMLIAGLIASGDNLMYVLGG